MTCLLSGSWPPKQCQARISGHGVGLTANQILGYSNNFCATIALHQISCRHITIVDWESCWWLPSLAPRTELSSSAYREGRLKNLQLSHFTSPCFLNWVLCVIHFSLLWPNSWQEAIEGRKDLLASGLEEGMAGTTVCCGGRGVGLLAHIVDQKAEICQE